MALWNLDLSNDMHATPPRTRKSSHSIDKIDYQIFSPMRDSPDLGRFFSRASISGHVEGLKTAGFKKKISRVCEDMIRISREAVSFLEEGNALQVLRKKSEFKPDFLRGLWKNYKRFLTRSVKSLQSVFEQPQDSNVTAFVEKYLETCLLNLKFFFVHLYEMATKFYAKKRAHQVSWDCGLSNPCPLRKRKFSCENADTRGSGRVGQPCGESADLSKSSVTSKSMSPDLAKNKMEKLLTQLLTTNRIKTPSSRAEPKTHRRTRRTPHKKSGSLSRKSSILKDVFEGLGAIHSSDHNSANFIIANCDALVESGKPLPGPNLGDSLNYDSSDDNTQFDRQYFLGGTHDSFLAKRKPSWLDKDLAEGLQKEGHSKQDGPREEPLERVEEESEEEVSVRPPPQPMSKKKRRKWLKSEDEVLLVFLRRVFPNSVSSAEMVQLASKLGRSKSSISNRLRVLKKAHKHEFQNMAGRIMGSVLSQTQEGPPRRTDSQQQSNNPKQSIECESHTHPSTGNHPPSSWIAPHNPRAKTETGERYSRILKTFAAIEPLLSSGEKTFVEVQNFLKVEREEQFHKVVDHLQELRQMCKLRSREAVFIEMREVVVKRLQQKKQGFWAEGGYSAILDFIFTSFYHKNFTQMTLREIKDKVIGQFNFDVGIRCFDEQFLQFLRQSQYFLISRKEVFFL